MTKSTLRPYSWHTILRPHCMHFCHLPTHSTSSLHQLTILKWRHCSEDWLQGKHMYTHTMGEVSKSSIPLHESHFRRPWERLVDNKINVDNNEHMPEKVLLRKLSVCSVRAIQQGGDVRAIDVTKTIHIYPLHPTQTDWTPWSIPHGCILVPWSVTLTFPLRFGHARFFFSSSGPKLIISRSWCNTSQLSWWKKNALGWRFMPSMEGTMFCFCNFVFFSVVLSTCISIVMYT